MALTSTLRRRRRPRARAVLDAADDQRRPGIDLFVERSVGSGNSSVIMEIIAQRRVTTFDLLAFPMSSKALNYMDAPRRRRRPNVDGCRAAVSAPTAQLTRICQIATV
jgi:hypothetical protein